jgi:hypothetical protein
MRSALRGGWRVCALGAIVVCAVAAGGASAGASGLTTVFVPHHACGDATPTRATCDAIRLVPKRVSVRKARDLVARGLARQAQPSSGAGPAGGYTPAQLAAAYGMSSDTATTQTVAIVDAYNDPSVAADLNAFDSQYGLPAEAGSSFTVVNEAGTTINPATTASPLSDVDWAGEITLDVDSVRGMCHGCKIILVETTSNQFADLSAGVNEAVALGATLVSNSYGGPEAANNPYASAYSHPGVAILASSGDSGWDSWVNGNYGAASYSRPNTPASFPSVVGVGGTSLTLNANNTRAGETVWDTPGAEDAQLGFATGGGCSGLYTAPSWEQAVAGYSLLGCGSTLRSGVDIAADADPYTGFDVYETTTSWCPVGSTDGRSHACPSNPGWQTFGGTSLASPLVAAMWALAGGPAGVSNPALTLYGHFKSAPSQLYDVTSGGNGFCGGDTASNCGAVSISQYGHTPNLLGLGLLDCRWNASGTVLANIAQCKAATGFDGPTGIGTPVGGSVFQPLSPTAVIQNPGGVPVGTSASFSATGSSVPFPGDQFSQYAWNWGDGSAETTTANASTSHKYTSAGAHTVTLTATDAYSASNGNRTGQTSIQLYSLTASTAGAGSGSVTSNPSGVNCGSTCIVAFESGTPVTLTAHPAGGSVFAGWSGAGCSGTGTCQVTMNAVSSVIATFDVAATNTLTASRTGSGAGSVTSQPAGIDCGSTCSHDFTTGASVTLTATPASGSVFTGWSGDCSGTGQCQVTMSAPHAVIATFAPLPQCHVPAVVGKTLTRATAAIKKANCSLGSVKRVFSAKKKGFVVGQSPAPGTTGAKNAPVDLRVSKGKRH